MEFVLETKSITKRYGSLRAVKPLNLAVPRGSIFGLLGPNGSGKTTTLGMVLGVTRASGGTYHWFGQALSFNGKQRIGAILENPNFYPYLSGLQNLTLVATIKEIKKPRLQEILSLVNLSERAHSKFKTYSLGMKQRLAIASALLSDPEVLVLDEPTNGLDPQGIAEMRSLILEIAGRGITVILASHLLYEVEKVCTDVAVLRQGELLYSGTVAELTGAGGVIEIAADQSEKLKELLEQHPAVKSIKEENGHLVVLLRQALNPAELNRYLARKQVYAHHLVFRKNSLEKQFLDLINA